MQDRCRLCSTSKQVQRGAYQQPAKLLQPVTRPLRSPLTCTGRSRSQHCRRWSSLQAFACSLRHVARLQDSQSGLAQDYLGGSVKGSFQHTTKGPPPDTSQPSDSTISFKPNRAMAGLPNEVCLPQRGACCLALPHHTSHLACAPEYRCNHMRLLPSSPFASILMRDTSLQLSPVDTYCGRQPGKGVHMWVSG